MLFISFSAEVNALLPEISEADREAVLSIILAYTRRSSAAAGVAQ